MNLLGKTTKRNGSVFISGLETNLLNVPDTEMNEPFLAWKGALKAWKKRGAIQFRRLQKGDDDAFAFLHSEDIRVEVLGPIPALVSGKPALRFLGNPPRGPRIGVEARSLDTGGFKGKSASHTINGHSIVLRLRFGSFAFLFAGDLNDEAERTITKAHNDGALNIRAEVFKVPHHGSADFSGAFLEAVAPVVSVVSSGDENARKEYIHPRSTLVGALGRFSRLEEPLLFVTEMVAFFQVEGWVLQETHKGKLKSGRGKTVSSTRGPFFSFSRTAYGMVRVRTDGHRLLVYTNSGRNDLKEAYALEADADGVVRHTAVKAV